MIGVILVGYGAPDSLEAVEPFLKSIAGRHSFTAEQIKKTVEKYRLIGGKSPLVKTTFKQAEAVRKELNDENVYSVFIGMLHWKPYIDDTLRNMIRKGISKIAVVTLAPFNSRASTGAYFQKVKSILKEYSHIKAKYITGWQNNEIYRNAMAGLIKTSLLKFGREALRDLQVVFTAHSLPQSYIEQGDPYVEELERTVEKIVSLCKIKNYTIAYQSKGRGGNWLKPDFIDILDDFAEKGNKNVLSVPIGFISDHLETLYDLDIVCRKYAESQGISLVRVPALNDSTGLAKAIAHEIKNKTSQWL